MASLSWRNFLALDDVNGGFGVIRWDLVDDDAPVMEKFLTLDYMGI